MVKQALFVALFNPVWVESFMGRGQPLARRLPTTMSSEPDDDDMIKGELPMDLPETSADGAPTPLVMRFEDSTGGELVTTERQGGLPEVIANPAFITFDAVGTLIELAEPAGMHYREVLFDHTGLRLPRPVVFDDAFAKVYAHANHKWPCFGCGESMSSRDWWATVVWHTYLEVGVPEDMLAPVFEDVFEDLHDHIFTGPQGYQLVRDAAYVLERIKQWSTLKGDAGPKLGVISNFDERLHEILETLDIARYFDVVLTSKECGMEKPCQQIFDIALARTGLYDKGSTVHVGQDFDADVVGATSAGWQAVYVKPPPYSEMEPNPSGAVYTRVGDVLRLLDVFGLEPDLDRPLVTTAQHGIFDFGEYK